MEPKELLSIATSAKDNYVDLKADNSNLKQILESLKTLINDYAESMPDMDENEKQEQELDDMLSVVDQQLVQSQLLLTELLNSKPHLRSSEETNALLKSIMKTFSTRILDVAKESITSGNANVSIFKLIDLEEEISKTIESLESKEMYPEAEQERNNRIQKTKAHSTKLSQYLQLLMQSLAKLRGAQENQKN